MLVDPDFHLLLERLGVKPRGLMEGVTDLRVRHAVIDDEVEADFRQREPQLGGGAVDRARLAREIGAEIDDGNGIGARAHSAAC